VGRVDVDAMLDELTPAQLVEWRAARHVVPLEDGWRQAGTIAATMHNEMELFKAAKAGKRHLDESRLRQPDDYIPKLKTVRRAELAVDEGSIAAHQAAMESRYRHAPLNPQP
jgi:hypothetical protein